MLELEELKLVVEVFKRSDFLVSLEPAASLDFSLPLVKNFFFANYLSSEMCLMLI